MRLLVIPDSFKGSLSSEQTVDAICQGLRKGAPHASVQAFPMADGGEGSSAIAAQAVSGSRIDLRVIGPEGEILPAFYYRAGPLALIELAAASGFTLSKRPRETATRATTYGTGQLIRHAIEHRCTEITLFLGGSATTDGGVGMAKALGVRFYDSEKNLLPNPLQMLEQQLEYPGEQLQHIASYDDAPARSLLDRARITAIVDVSNPLCGPMGAAAVFGPQKGLTPELLPVLDQALGNLSAVVERHTGKDFSKEPGVGAAGGSGFAVRALLHGKMRPGSQFFLDLIDFTKHVNATDCVITGEGRADPQSFQGKLLGTILSRVPAGMPVISLVGENTLPESVLAQHPNLKIYSIPPQHSWELAFPALAVIAERAAQDFCAGRS